MNVPSSWLVRLRRERRALVGLVALTLLAGLAGLIELDAQLEGARMRLRQAEQQKTRLAALAGEIYWPTVRQEVAAALAAFRARAWREESEGRIKARLQDWLREQLDAAQIRVRELAVAEPTAGAGENETALPADMRLVRARLSVEFASDTLPVFLAKLSEQERWLWVERLTVKNPARPPRQADIELAALFVVGAGPEPSMVRKDALPHEPRRPVSQPSPRPRRRRGLPSKLPLRP